MNLRKKLTTKNFEAKERTPSPQEKPKPAAARGKINAANLFGQDSDEEEKKKPAQQTRAKVKIPVFNMDEEEEEKKVEKPKPKKLPKQDEGDDFKNNLAAMLARGPRPMAARAPPRATHMQTSEELFEEKLAIPTLAKKRAATKKFDLDKFDAFKDF